VLWTNCEAATEIARQLRLRNIAGVIVVDFIDMESRRDQLQVLEHFNKALKADKARPQIAQLTELGLVELTRKRQGQNIYELFGETCPTCGGLGHTVRLPGENENRLPTPVEIPERFVSLPHKEPRLPATRIPETRENYDAFGEGFDGDSDLSALNLMNHPSYQELADNNKRRTRTRRSRIGINGANGKDEARITTHPLTFDNEPDLDLDAEVELGPTPEIPSPNLGKSGWAERVERNKVTKVEPVKPVVEPPEIRTVEMTLQEQDVFALMGVSPLVKLEREVKNPKSVIINIVQPGQLPTVSTESTPESTVTATESSDVNTDTLQTETKHKPLPENISEPENTSEPAEFVANPMGGFTNAEETEANSTFIGNRRRRRRSSAIEDRSTTDEN